MTIGKRARKWFYENILQSGCRVYLDKRLIKIIDEIVSYFLSNYPYIGMIRIEDYLFGEYVNIANNIYKRYGRKLPIEVFSNMIIKKIKEDGRLELITEKKYIFPSKIEADSLCNYCEVRAKVFGEIRKYKYPGGANVYWNSGATIDKEFIRKYLKSYFETIIKKSFWKEFKKLAKGFEFEISGFRYYLNPILYSEEIECLKHFANISDEEIMEEIKVLSEAEDLVMRVEDGLENHKFYYLLIK